MFRCNTLNRFDFITTSDSTVSDGSIGIAHSHSNEDVSVLVHFKPPVWHAYSPDYKTVKDTRVKQKFEGKNQIKVDLLRRQSGGSITAQMGWVHYAANGMDP